MTLELNIGLDETNNISSGKFRACGRIVAACFSTNPEDGVPVPFAMRRYASIIPPDPNAEYFFTKLKGNRFNLPTDVNLAIVAPTLVDHYIESRHLGTNDLHLNFHLDGPVNSETIDYLQQAYGHMARVDVRGYVKRNQFRKGVDLTARWRLKELRPPIVQQAHLTAYFLLKQLSRDLTQHERFVPFSLKPDLVNVKRLEL